MIVAIKRMLKDSRLNPGSTEIIGARIEPLISLLFTVIFPIAIIFFESEMYLFFPWCEVFRSFLFFFL